MPSAAAQKIGCMKPRISQKNASVTASSRATKNVRSTLLSVIGIPCRWPAARASSFVLVLTPPRAALGYGFLVAGAAGLVPARTAQRLGQILLAACVPAFGMVVAVALAVADVLHELRRRVADVQRHGLGRVLARGRERGAPRAVDGVRLRRRREIDDR